MGLKRCRIPFQTLLQEFYRKPHPACQFQRRNYIGGGGEFNVNEKLDIAVLGGGITGLTSAWHLSHILPNAKITVFEAQKRLGGWLHSDRVDVDDGYVIFERGPRTLRPPGPASAFATLELIRQLKLEAEVLSTPRSSNAARNRYIYYPDHLVLLPGPGQSAQQMLNTALNEPLFKGVIWGLLTEAFRAPRPPSRQDESVGSFMQRRFGTVLTENILSAVLHGIYAGDTYKLSIKSIMPLLWDLEGRYASVLMGLLSLRGQKNERPTWTIKDIEYARKLSSEFFLKGQEIEPWREIMNSSAYTFRHGIEQLARTLIAALEARPNVMLSTGTSAKTLRAGMDPATGEEKVLVETSNGQTKSEPRSFSRVISTLPASADIYPGYSNDNAWDQGPPANVMVVNLYFPPPTTLPVNGFGYLIPRSLPFSQNPEFALGVVFDSDATPALGTAPGVTLTVMLGGHWWDGWTSLPNAEEGVKMARAVLQRHLGIDTAPAASQATLQQQCIPQYTVGHASRMQVLHQCLQRDFGGLVSVAGANYHGVSVNDCIRSGFEAATRITTTSSGSGKPSTGLEDYGFRQYAWGRGQGRDEFYETW